VDWAQVASTAAGVDVIGCLFAILLGYVFFVRFVRKQGLRYFRVETEIALAEQIHRGLVPPIVRHTSRDEFYGVSAPSGVMGGDLVDLVQDGNKWIGYLADVSGHGVPSGVLMAMVKSAVRMRLATSSEPQVLLEDLNRVIFELIAAEMFVTLAFVSLGKSNDLHFATAGHLPILHLRSATGRSANFPLPIHPLESSKSRSSRVLTWNSQAVISRFS
jgi:serine phosphatase RsbU (regulator of sigma subunit)